MLPGTLRARRSGKLAGRVTVLALLGTLAACTAPDMQPPDQTAGFPEATPPTQPAEPDQAAIRRARAERNRAANATAALTLPAAQNGSHSAYYVRAEADLLAQGRLRRDPAPGDAGLDPDRLTRDFLQIALRDEYSRDGARLIADSHAAPLRRWTGPVRFQVEHGLSTDLALQRRDRAEIAALARRLSQTSNHPVELSGSRGNFLVLILTEAERRQIGPRLAELVPGIPASDIAAITGLSPRNYCTVFAYSRGDGPGYVQAVALVRAELPSLLRSSCFHEELAQGMGLANDSPEARPSIFNDDEEFALLTRHDELLLRILYDPRLSPGMTEAQAAPIVRRIATELLAART